MLTLLLAIAIVIPAMAAKPTLPKDVKKQVLKTCDQPKETHTSNGYQMLDCDGDGNLNLVIITIVESPFVAQRIITQASESVARAKNLENMRRLLGKPRRSNTRDELRTEKDGLCLYRNGKQKGCDASYIVSIHSPEGKRYQQMFNESKNRHP